MKIIIKNLQKRITISPSQIKKAASKFCSLSKTQRYTYAFYFVTNSTIKTLNEQFFKKNVLTDVISFNLNNRYAELFISPAVVKNNAGYYGVNFCEELLRCVIHGMLHVHGYEDTTPKKKRKMWLKQENLLSKIH